MTDNQNIISFGNLEIKIGGYALDNYIEVQEKEIWFDIRDQIPDYNKPIMVKLKSNVGSNRYLITKGMRVEDSHLPNNFSFDDGIVNFLCYCEFEIVEWIYFENYTPAGLYLNPISCGKI